MEYNKIPFFACDVIKKTVLDLEEEAEARKEFPNRKEWRKEKSKRYKNKMLRSTQDYIELKSRNQLPKELR